MTKKKKSISNIIFNVVIAVVLLAGIGLLAYPTVANMHNERYASQTIAGYVEDVANLTIEDAARLREEAEAFNEWLKQREMRFAMEEDEIEYYNSVLNINGSGIMAYIDIPKIHVTLPIYHGTDDTVLAIAVGHLEGTALPIGGKGNHVAMSGHTGLPSAHLFNDLNKLEIGDLFYIKVLNETLTYQVDQIEVVLPNDFSLLAAEEDKDLCTLITCTPYGVNSHRLMVRGQRVETENS